MVNDFRLKILKGCARCHDTHENLVFTRFVGDPIADEDGTLWGWWALCPLTGDPILLRQEAVNPEMGEIVA